MIETRDDQYQEEAAFVAERIVRMLREGTPVRDGDSCGRFARRTL